jgi:hypothetical protein
MGVIAEWEVRSADLGQGALNFLFLQNYDFRKALPK